MYTPPPKEYQCFLSCWKLKCHVSNYSQALSHFQVSMITKRNELSYSRLLPLRLDCVCWESRHHVTQTRQGLWVSYLAYSVTVFFLPLFSKFLQCVKQLGLQAMPLKHSDKWLGVVFGFNCQFNISRHHLGKAFQMIVTDRPVCGFVGDYLDCSCWGRKHISWAGSPTSSYKKGCCVLAWVLACSH